MIWSSDQQIAINVALRLTPTEVDQLWVADITSMRLGRVDAFLAVATDAFPRKIIGWNVGPLLATELPGSAVQGVKTLKQEEIRCSPYKDIDNLRANISHFLTDYYNAKRLHPALGYQSPDWFCLCGGHTVEEKL